MKANRLINESSPYLQQHAYNPVDWYPWGEEALNKAKAENKLILLSIGYSSCHWCHVMEHECFEQHDVADVMNTNFINIKLDREERPDIDQVYMLALQAMTGRGGWPLNVILLPDGRPVYGGTYFPREQWKTILLRLAKFYRDEPAKAIEYANELHEGLSKVENFSLDDVPPKSNITPEILQKIVSVWKPLFDDEFGGPHKAPKFPLPNNYLFLLQQGQFEEDQDLQVHVLTTLYTMANAGINDIIGGGFYRYSTDREWKIPHFEKMLYDNAQLISLYVEAYKATDEQLFKEVALQTKQFLDRELMGPNGLYYSALDADSEGVEGLYYTWTLEELKEIFANDYPLANLWYHIESNGEWEERYILQTLESIEDFCENNGLDEVVFEKNRVVWREKLLKLRQERIRPFLDDKQLCSWNAMMLEAIVDLYSINLVSTEELNTKVKGFIEHFIASDFKLYHQVHNGNAKGVSFLDDYAFTIQALLKVYAATGDSKHWDIANKLTEHVYAHFKDVDSTMFYFYPDYSDNLIIRNKETGDNVIPASNSAMALNLFKMGHLAGNTEWISRAETSLSMVQSFVERYPSGYSNWAQLMQMMAYPWFQVSIVGPKASQYVKEWKEGQRVNHVLSWTETASELPMFAGRYVENKTLVYLCLGHTCWAPFDNIKDALARLEETA